MNVRVIALSSLCIKVRSFDEALAGRPQRANARQAKTAVSWMVLSAADKPNDRQRQTTRAGAPNGSDHHAK
jgi:hypothetical protein